MKTHSPNRFVTLAVLATSCAITGISLGASPPPGAAGASAPAATGASPAGKIARLSDGRPDFNGTWENGSGYDFIKPQKGADGSICISGCKPAATAGSAPAAPAPRARVEPDRPKYKPELMAQVADLTKRQVDTDPVIRCKAPGLPRIGPPDKIVQRPGEVVFLYDDVSGSFWRIIPTDGRKHREDADESYLGNAVGHWEGDALVVESVGFNEDTWLTDNGAFHTTGLRVVERLTRDGDTMEWQATAYDPKVLVEPWKVRPRKMTLVAQELQEPVPCVEQDLKHVVDGTHHDNPR
ncbi:MAG TPA: hypothetical protein VGO53_11450 [Steroidobacteraceae bacterium]|nr:hypothetical protein [Steroidobacteraceae bacterium]